jgi:cardiolipin synthase
LKTFRRIFSKVFSLIFNRLTIVLAAIAIQLTYFIMLILRLFAYAHWVNVSFRALTVLMVICIVWQDRNPAYKIGWIVFMAMFPEVGAVLFIVFGGRLPSRGIRKRLARQEALHKNDFLQVEPLDMLGENRERSTARYVAEHGAYPLWDHTASKYYPVGGKTVR